MNKLIKLLLPLTLLAGSQLALADVYVGAGVNITSIDADVKDDKDTVPSFFVGWKPIDFVAVEAGYYDLGQYDDVEATAYTVAALGILPAFIFDFYAKVGYADTSVDGLSSSTKEEEESTAFYALGANINVTSLIDIYAEVQRISMTDKTDVDMFGVGARLVF